MKKAKSKLLYMLAVLLGALFVLACIAGFAACGGENPEESGGGGNGGGNGDGNGGVATTQRFEAEDAELWADENEMVYWLNEEVFQGEMIVDMGFIFGVKEDDTASGEYSVGYLAHNKPTATFTIKSSKAVSGVTLTLGGASCDVDVKGASTVYGLLGAAVYDYAGADHDILTVNGKAVTLSGTLPGSDSVFTDSGLAMNNWGTLTATIDLVEGDNTIVLTHDSAGVNWDYIEITTDATLSMTKTDNSNFESFEEDWEPEDVDD